MSLAAGEAPARSQSPSDLQRLRVQELSAPTAPTALAVYAHAPVGARRFLWVQPERSLALVGVGAAHVWRPSIRRRRFSEAAGFAEELAHRLGPALPRAEATAGGLDGAAGTAPAGPLVCGGFAFDSTPPRSAPHLDRWRRFGAGRLVVPELVGIIGPQGSRWIVTAPAADLATATARAEALLRSAADSPPTARPIHLDGVGGDEADDYLATIQSALSQIGAGAFEKVVPARQISARVSGAAGQAAEAELLRRLADRYPTATTYAVSCGNVTLLGATPELLIRTGGDLAEAEALAGSCPRGVDGAPDEPARAMLTNPKERHEHATVVDHLRRAMMCAGVKLDAVPTEPRIRSLPLIQHLSTPVRGRLRIGPGTVFELIDALHPTPAVAGRPPQEALDFLRNHEPADRGWFAGPVGWADMAGNGEFCMALRSGLLEVDTGRMTLFAGSGVVTGSDPATELAETAIKLNAVPLVGDDPSGRR